MNKRIRGYSLIMLLSVGIYSAIAAAALAPDKTLPTLCKHLQQQGWVAPSDPLHPGQRQQSEMSVPGVMYMCTLEHPLTGGGPGRDPDLQVLLSDSGDGASVIFSADVWCEADRVATLNALAEQTLGALRGVDWTIPKETLDAIRTGKSSEMKSATLKFGTHPIAVDAQACTKVPKGAFGAVLMKIDVTIEPAAKRAGKKSSAND